MKTRFLMTAAAVAIAGTMAFADAFTDQIVADLQGQGFTAIEIKNGINQIKVEAIRGDIKIEVVYDRSTGQILKQEQESSAGENIREGVSIRDEDRDFVRGSRQDDDRGSDDAEEDDDERRGRGADDDEEDDDRGRGRGGDEGADDDHDDDHDEDDEDDEEEDDESDDDEEDEEDESEDD